MELMGGGGHDKVAWEKSRKLYLSASRPLAPCMDSVIPVEARSICLMYLTPRLFELAGLDLGNPDPAHFGKAMNYCEAIPKSEISLRKDCYGGFGKEFVPLVTARDIRSINKIDEKSFATLAEWCGSGKTTEAISACVSSELDSLFWGGENDPRISIRFCASLPSGVSRDACYSELATTISTYTNGDAQKTLCVSVPADKQAQCLASHPPRSQS